ncbi:MAG: GNAT family N-acetyltransferase [Cyclobacteriaceae bacterium]|nr:GNAT family N-acetyltransferase [Cyclobacteriaceae bacterium]
MDVQIRRLQENDLPDFIALLRVFETVFEMKNFQLPPHVHLKQLLARSDFYVFAALSDTGVVVGGLTAYTLIQYYSVQPLVYIFDLAIQKSFQRQGIGQALISAITHHCRAEGVEEVFVQADRVDAHAVNFYRKTAACEEDVVHFYYPLIKNDN